MGSSNAALFLSLFLTDSLTLSLSASLVLAYLCVCAVQESGHRMSNAPQFILLGLSMFTMV